ncbi:meiosis protein MEI2 [Thermoascus aurantiacus ATCC 26904]
MRVNDSSHLTSSPHSSNGAVSRHGSPDTKLTAFSPEDVRSKGHTESIIDAPGNDEDLRGFYPATGPDPFLAPPGSSGRVQLSPTASSFTPVGMNAPVTGGGSACPSASTISGVGYLAANSEPDTHTLGNEYIKLPDQNASDFGPIGKTRFIKEGLSPSPITIGQYDCDRRSRAFVIEDVPTSLSYLTLAGFFNRREFGTLKGPILSDLNSKGKIYVAFTDSREAKNAMEKIQHLRPEWRVLPLTAKEYAQHSETSIPGQTSDFEGQIFVSVYYDSRNPSLDENAIARSVKDLAETFGDVKTFNTLPTGQENVSDFHVEFFDTRDAENAVTTLNGTSVDNCILEVKHYKPDVESPSDARCAGSSPLKGPSPHHKTPYGRLYASASFAGITHSPYLELSPTGRSTVPRGERVGLMDWLSKSEERLVFPPRREFNRYSDPRSSNQNFVDTERIRRGLDVRTTIMLRNIPNKIDQAMLKEIVDETSHGKYDFMYLRIDFANNCNVGYAFINFEDPIDIIDFVNARAGRTWNCFNSDKVAEVSYATIQGKDCLVQKFRNSSVMLEHPSFRPKIFHTGTGPLAGTEDRFPGPDNPSKMRRSVENAEHVGLFAPRVGQQYRDEQRRRRSQYDRGTTAAEREIVYVRTCTPRRSAAMNGFRSAPCTLPSMKSWCDPQVSPCGPRSS